MLRRDVIIAILMMLSAVFNIAEAKQFTLVIDAGHGGHDAGAIGSFSKEKDINLRTALAFGKYVEQYAPDVRVIYTRKTDKFVTLHGRADIANKAKADLFISIHTNALPGGRISRGLETYTLGMHRASDNLDVAKRENSVILVEKDYKERYQGFDPNSSESYIIFEFMQDNNMQRSVDLASLVQRNVCSTASRPNKGVKQAGFLVLRETSMPSCLIELGFISTPDEERLLNDAQGVDNIARGIYQAFASYKNKYDSNATSTLTAIVPARETSTDNPQKVKEEAPAKSETEVAKSEREPAKTECETPKNDEQENTAQKVDATDQPVFKVQVFVVPNVLNKSDSRFKGRTDCDYYKENGMVKYTVGESVNYNEIYRLRKDLLNSYPDCFIIAFKNGGKMNVNEAIREYKANKNR